MNQKNIFPNKFQNNIEGEITSKIEKTWTFNYDSNGNIIIN